MSRRVDIARGPGFRRSNPLVAVRVAAALLNLPLKSITSKNLAPCPRQSQSRCSQAGSEPQGEGMPARFPAVFSAA